MCPTHTVKRVFIYRWAQFRLKISSHGYCYDIQNVLEKYSLTHWLNFYLDTGDFPAKINWKVTIKKAVWNREVSSWLKNISNSVFGRFRSLHDQYRLSYIWAYASSHPYKVSYCKSIARFISFTSRFNEICSKCNGLTGDICLTDHIILDCPVLRTFRTKLLGYINVVFGSSICYFLSTLDRQCLVNVLLGKYCPIVDLHLKCNYDYFMDVIFKHIHIAWLHYSQYENIHTD